MTDLQTDLPIIPCYEDKDCENQLNCGALCDYQLSEDVNSIIPCADGSDRYYGTCHGKNELACNGIQSCCNPNIPSEDLSCNMNSEFAKNGEDNYLGCTIGSPDNDFSCGEYRSTCMEFDRPIDKIVGTDSDLACWINGGNEIVKSQCEEKIGSDENMCRAMEYFCDWDSFQGLCTVNTVNTATPPFVNFNTKYQTDVSTLFLRKDCTGLDDNSDCIEHPGLDIEDNERYYVNSARSSWDSKKETSTHPLARINCVHDTKFDKKVCINLPRCQMVESKEQCGRVTKNGEGCTNYFENSLTPCSSDEIGENDEDSVFMCGRTGFLDTDGAKTASGFGYITWCTGTQEGTPFVIPETESQRLINAGIGIIPITRDPIDWENSSGRCGNYDECESNDSEELWNKCMFDKTGSVYGEEYAVDYTTEEYKAMTKEEKLNKLRTDGYCGDKDSDDWFIKKAYQDECEKELEYLGSINWGRVFSPNGQTAACQYRYNWTHECLVLPDNTKLTENYSCTWCPSLQCKIGSKDQICSEVAEGDNSWNRLPYCDTNSSFGKVINPNAPDQCDCYLPKTRNDAPVVSESKVLDTETIAVLSTGLGLSTIVIIAAIMAP